MKLCHERVRVALTAKLQQAKPYQPMASYVTFFFIWKHEFWHAQLIAVFNYYFDICYKDDSRLFYSFLCPIHWLMPRVKSRMKRVDHSDVVGASPVGAAPTTSEWSTSFLHQRHEAPPLSVTAVMLDCTRAPEPWQTRRSTSCWVSSPVHHWKQLKAPSGPQQRNCI